jgi:hypothetical protein
LGRCHHYRGCLIIAYFELIGIFFCFLVGAVSCIGLLEEGFGLAGFSLFVGSSLGWCLRGINVMMVNYC